jgi:hypothetical protein
VTPRYKRAYKLPKTKPNMTSIGKCTPKISLEIAIAISKETKIAKTIQF